MNRLLFGVGVASIVLVAGGQERAIAATFSIQQIASQISQKLQIPVLLPSETTVEQYKFSKDETIYSTTSYEEGGYRVTFNNRPGDPGNAAFRFLIGAYPGKEIERRPPDQNPRYNPEFKQVKLADGSQALVTMWCGGTACWSSVQWKSSSVLYSVAAKTNNPEAALAIANSAVKAGDRAKPSVKTADNRSSQSIETLADGTYFYGQSPEVNQVGKTYYLFKKRGDQATGLVFAPRSGDSPCFTGTIQGNQIKRVTLAFASYDRSGKNANWALSQAADYNFNGIYRLDVNQYRGDVKDEISRCQSGIAQVVAPSQPSSTSSPQANGQKGAVNLGGSSYFSWGLLKPESRDNNQSQIVMGYGCQTQNQLEGISQRASVSRYVIKRGRGSDDWWLESLGGVVVRPTPNGYVSEKVEGISSSELKRYITDSSSGFLKRDMDVDGLGNACINGGIQGALNYIQGSGSSKPIAQPPKPPSSGYSEKEFVQSWSSANPALKPFLGTWIEPEGNIRIYPATVKDQVCLVVNTSGEMIVDIGTVTNGQITKLGEGRGPYISRRGKPGERSMGVGQPENQELLVSANTKGNLVAWRFLNRDTTSIKVQHPSQGLQGLPQEVLRVRSAEIQKFDRAGCTTGLPEGAIAQPVKPLTPIASANTYAYPSPAEFTQFKKTLRPSPIALSAADRKLRQDFQAEWQKKNPAIGPYVGAWKTADNQDVYVFPSTQAGRACVVEKSDGEFKAVIGVSMKADMRYALTRGLFRVTGVGDVVAGRSDKLQPLAAFYGAIGSPDVSVSVRQDLEQAKCVTELPRSLK
jgi:hypothetical protein